MQYRFFLDDLEVDEPIGWDGFELSMKRDDKYHGMQFEASTGTLKFVGEGAEYLRGKKEDEGLSANVLFIAELGCDDEFEEIYRGRLNFGKYRDSCGTNCIVSVPAEEESCAVVFKNRFDQKVDVDSSVAFDKITNLPDYDKLNFGISLPPKALKASVDGSVDADGYVIDEDINNGIQGSTIFIRPSYDVERYNGIATGQLQPVTDHECNRGCFDLGPLTPQLLMEDVIECFNGDFVYDIRFKGVVTITGTGTLFWIKLKVFKWDAVGSIFTSGTILQHVTLFDGGFTPPVDPVQPFDGTVTGSTTIEDGLGFYAVLEVALGNGSMHLNVAFDSDTYFTLTAVRSCPATDAKVNMIHECLSRVTEAVTDLCVRVKSEYYGRTDSQPFAFDSDGCGSLRLLTSGLKIRRAPEDKFFASPKDLIEGLNAIDNIGFHIEDDPERIGKKILRIEPVAYWYRDSELLSLVGIQEGNSEVNESGHYSKVLVGYKKWEVEKVNGLDEFNSNREYRTSLETINNSLDITSGLVAGGYAIETTRDQSFADTGAADTKYDNEIFIICLQRMAYDFIVEQNNISSPENIFDPATVYNFRISPIRNLMRWFKSIINSYPSIGGTENKLFFSSGTGNLTAKGELILGAYDALCKLENMPMSESQDLFAANFLRPEDATPLWKNENISFEYPLSVADWRYLKSNPYGYISVQCGNGEFEKAFIKEIKYKISSGKANFTLIKKW